jgi:2-polyprenyl-6-methoxyphenol hydroxylase-like FAD-dependent oxidoreductase
LPNDSGNQFSPERTLRIPQSYLEPVLRDEVRKLPTVEFRTGWKVERFSDEGDGVRAEIVHLASGQSQHITAAYLAGCDGGRSAVRKELGITMRGSAASAEAMGGVFRAPGL